MFLIADLGCRSLSLKSLPAFGFGKETLPSVSCDRHAQKARNSFVLNFASTGLFQLSYVEIAFYFKMVLRRNFPISVFTVVWIIGKTEILIDKKFSILGLGH